MSIDLDKLEDIFRKRYRELCRGEDFRVEEDFFVGWCDKHKIIMLHPEYLAEVLNDGAMKGRVCISSPEQGRDPPPWLLVPKKFAERAIILGYLP